MYVHVCVRTLNFSSHFNVHRPTGWYVVRIVANSDGLAVLFQDTCFAFIGIFGVREVVGGQGASMHTPYGAPLWDLRVLLDTTANQATS